MSQLQSASLFNVLSDATRRTLLDALLSGPKAVNDLVAEAGASQPVVSKQLRILREADLVRVQRDGQRRLYSINAQPLQQMDAWLQPYRQLWANRLDALEAHLDSLPATDPTSSAAAADNPNKIPATRSKQND